MQDEPNPIEILAAVAHLLRNVVVPESKAHTAFQARVAANALDLVGRQLVLAAATDMDEHRRLNQILHREGTVAELNASFAAELADGRLDLNAPGVKDHLFASSFAKLAVDQPNYSAYRRALAESADLVPLPQS